jgi:hypothetical protein
MTVRLPVEERSNGDMPHSVAKGDHQWIGQITSVGAEEALWPEHLWIPPDFWIGEYESNSKVIMESLRSMEL